MSKSNQVRIIGGRWRGRILKFPAIEALRPTHDRVRETLFNWLAPYIVDAKCLDLFAGSGVIGFEASSRGAQSVVLLDQDKEIIAALRKNKYILEADAVQVLQGKIPNNSIRLKDKPFDIVFLDPPYNLNLIPRAIKWLIENESIKIGTLIYIETERQLEMDYLPLNWKVIKSNQTKNIAYSLVEVN